MADRRTIQDRIADNITAFSGSMLFVHLHTALFVWWIATDGWPLNDPFPFGLLTMAVSLEAIYLSTFVLISQNRAAEKRAKMEHTQFILVRASERQNERIIEINHENREILDRLEQAIREIHKRTLI